MTTHGRVAVSHDLQVCSWPRDAPHQRPQPPAHPGEQRTQL